MAVRNEVHAGTVIVIAGTVATVVRVFTNISLIHSLALGIFFGLCILLQSTHEHVAILENKDKKNQIQLKVLDSKKSRLVSFNKIVDSKEKNLLELEDLQQRSLRRLRASNSGD